jgi:hypothetical protein
MTRVARRSNALGPLRAQHWGPDLRIAVSTHSLSGLRSYQVLYVTPKR